MIVALVPMEAAGMASAVTVVARQGGFAILGAAMPAGFALVFALVALASALGCAAYMLLPHSGGAD